MRRETPRERKNPFAYGGGWVAAETSVSDERNSAQLCFPHLGRRNQDARSGLLPAAAARDKAPHELLVRARYVEVAAREVEPVPRRVDATQEALHRVRLLRDAKVGQLQQRHQERARVRGVLHVPAGDRAVPVNDFGEHRARAARVRERGEDVRVVLGEQRLVAQQHVAVLAVGKVLVVEVGAVREREETSALVRRGSLTSTIPPDELTPTPARRRQRRTPWCAVARQPR